MQIPHARTLPKLFLLAALGLGSLIGLTGCPELRQKTSCISYFKSGDLGHFKPESPAVVRDTRSGLLWYRCSAGQSLLDGRCVGNPLVLDWQAAQDFTKEFSSVSGRTWRVPEYKEMKALSEKACDNPSYNPNAFPDLPIENFWTTTAQRGSPWQACSIYSHTGHGHCRSRRVDPMLFLLVSDP